MSRALYKSNITALDLECSVLILDGDGLLSLRVMRCLAQVPGFEVHVLSSDRRDISRFSRFCKSFHMSDPAGDEEDLLETIGKVARKVRASVLLPVTQPGISFAVRHVRALRRIAPVAGLPGPEVLDIAKDKWKLAQLMQERGIPTPATLSGTKDGDWRRLEVLPFPVLAKPVEGFNGSGIREFSDPASLTAFLEQHANDPEKYIVQRMVRGYDIDCSVLCRDGKILAYTIQKSIIPNPVPFQLPLGVEFVHQEEVLAVVRRLMSELGWTGVAHLDLMIDEENGGVQVIEINPRYWGSLFGSLGAGVNFPHLACLEALQRPLPRAGFQAYRYMEPGAVLKLLKARSLAEGVKRFRFSETGWNHELTDPLPFLYRAWEKLRSP